MTQDEIIEMAREACLFYMDYIRVDSMKQLEDFANLVAAKAREACGEVAIKAAEKAIDVAIELEREACAKVAEQFEPDEKTSYVTYASTAIRARGQA